MPPTELFVALEWNWLTIMNPRKIKGFRDNNSFTQPFSNRKDYRLELFTSLKGLCRVVTNLIWVKIKLERRIKLLWKNPLENCYEID
jgi:hypothetical protein